MGEVNNLFKGYSCTQLNGQRIFRRIDAAGRDILAPVGRGLEILVKNIPFDCNDTLLFRLFLQAGVIYEMRVMVTHDGGCRGIAFIKYESPVNSRLAKAILNGCNVGKKDLIVEESKEFHELVFSGIPSSVSMKCIETFFKSKFCDVVAIEQFSSSGGYMKVTVAFFSHRAAAIARREFSGKKNFFWNSHITAEWPETTKLHMRKAAWTSQAPKSNLNLTEWQGVEDSLLTKEFWDNYFTSLWEEQQRLTNNTNLYKYDRHWKQSNQTE